MSDNESQAGPTKGIAELIADKETMSQRIKELKQRLAATEAERDTLRGLVHCCPVCGESCKECSCMQAKLDAMKALLREAVDAWDSGDFYEIIWDDWMARAKECCSE
jgi:DNA repair exonuclease SbcCD ATPase subunit